MREELGILCCTWDDPRGILRMFEQPTIEDFDFLLFFDGKFAQWEGLREFADHETHAMVKDFGDTHDINTYYEYVANKTEAEKRSYMFKRAADIGINWALVVDSDEIPYIDKHEWNIERDFLKDSEFGCHSVILNNYGLSQRRPRLFNMKEEPYLIQHPTNLSHNKIYSSINGRDLTEDITKTTFDCKSIELSHDKEFHSKYRWKYRYEFAKVKNH